jgi:large subunit ribosomal protein L18
MNREKAKQQRRLRRRKRVRKHVVGTAERPRLSVFRSLRHIYGQIIDDGRARTLCAASSRDKALAGKLAAGGNKDAAATVGKLLAERAVAAGIRKVTFDRGGYRFHGRVKALAEAVREGGVKF